MDLRDKIREQLLERLKAYRGDLERRIAFLEAGTAQVRLKHQGEWIDATPTVLAAIYCQCGDLGPLINDITVARADQAA